VCVCIYIYIYIYIYNLLHNILTSQFLPFLGMGNISCTVLCVRNDMPFPISAKCSMYIILKCSKASLMKIVGMSKHLAILILYKNCCVRWKFVYFLPHKATHSGMPIVRTVGATREQSGSERRVCSAVSSILSRRPLKPLHYE
jgi:hypothetical protein